MADTPFVGDVGVIVKVVIRNSSDNQPRNISQATVKKVNIKKPGGSSFVRDMEFVTDGSDGQLKYTSTAGDLSAMGVYICQISLVMSDWSGSTTIFSFSVKNTL